MGRRNDGGRKINGFLKIFIATVLTLAITLIAFVTINN